MSIVSWHFLFVVNCFARYYPCHLYFGLFLVFNISHSWFLAVFCQGPGTKWLLREKKKHKGTNERVESLKVMFYQESKGKFKEATETAQNKNFFLASAIPGRERRPHENGQIYKRGFTNLLSQRCRCDLHWQRWILRLIYLRQELLFFCPFKLVKRALRQ